ncbi:Anti-sigma-B factor antagonist [Streptomyces sp. MBT84]|uniref:STAS domain-containing protein n=2 Tax=Streptomyces TaxID=1883 RepID=UPI00099EC5B9|nr:Anti-sigma-B factor antagonist [Streptomyces sp. MBT84]REE60717.1 SpoIIAA-like anti-anti-sigma regulatory factor [Streptomyces sp. 3212.3]
MRTNIIRSERMVVSFDVVNGWTVLEVDGEIDVHTSPRIREAVIKLLDEGHRHLVLDLCFVPFLDSVGLGAVVASTKRVREHGGSLRITCPSGRSRKVFEISGLHDAYEFYDSPEDATLYAPSVDGLVHWPDG